jgi:transcriptional regulator with XRE-family HTH domain
MPKKAAKTTAKRGRSSTTKRIGAVPAAVDAASSLTGSIRNLAGQVIDIAGAAVDASLGVGGLLARDAIQRKDLARAGAFLRKVREQAGLTIADVGQAVDLKDIMLLELAESGKAALPFEVILRLAAVLARNDPIPFVLNLTNTYSPAIGRTLKALGIGRLVEHARREHDFINVYRARDAARHLSDAEFARVLAFVEAAFDLALDFTTRGSAARKAAKAAAGAAAAAGERRRPG